MNRRALLASGITLGLSSFAGCTGFGGTLGVGRGAAAALRMTPISDTEIATRLTYRRGVDEESPDYDLVHAAVHDPTTTVEDTEPPFSEGYPFVFEEAVYELAFDVVDEQPATRFHVTLDPPEGEVAAEDVVAYADLPAVDKAVFERRQWGKSPTVGIGTSLLYLDTHVADSALIPDPEHSVIEWADGTRVAFSVDGSHDTTYKSYEYTAEQVHDSAAGYGREIRERHEFTLSGLSQAEQEVVTEAIREEYGYVVGHDESVPAVMRQLGDRFRPQKDVDRVGTGETRADEGEQTVDGMYLVRHDGDVYWTDIRVRETSPTAEPS